MLRYIMSIYFTSTIAQSDEQVEKTTSKKCKLNKNNTDILDSNSNALKESKLYNNEQ